MPLVIMEIELGLLLLVVRGLCFKIREKGRMWRSPTQGVFHTVSAIRALAGLHVPFKGVPHKSYKCIRTA